MSNSYSIWIWVVGVVLIAALAAFLVLRPKPQPSGRILQAPDEAASREAMLGLREKAFEHTPETLGLQDTEVDPYGLIVDWAMDSGVATVTAFSTGDFSLYTTTGFGVIGGIAHEPVRKAAINAVNTGKDSKLPRSDDTSLPGEGMVRITFLTRHGRLTAMASEQELRSGRHELSPVFHAANEVISELRRISGP